MQTRLRSRIVMLGAGPETRGAVATLVEAYRAHGLFEHWPIDYIAISSGEAPHRQAAVYARALRDYALALVHEPRSAVHLHLSRSLWWRQAAFAAAALAARCPLVLQLHGSGLGAEAAPLLARAACVVVSCEASRLWVRSVARNAHVVCVPPPAAAVAAPASGYGASRPNVVLFLGRLEAAKGIYDVLDALAGVREAVPDARLVCAGDGDRTGVARHAERLGIGDAVKFTGWVGPSGKRALLETAAAFVLPSYDEALPVSLVEAMAAGVPPIVSPVGGMAEAVQEGVSGFFVAPGDRSGLARRLKRVLLDRALAARVGAAARESARLRFSPARALARLGDIYASLGVREPAHGGEALKKAA